MQARLVGWSHALGCPGEGVVEGVEVLTQRHRRAFGSGPTVVVDHGAPESGRLLEQGVVSGLLQRCRVLLHLGEGGHLCRALGIEHPVFCAGIGAAAGAELVAAVSNAGGCGVLGTASLPGKFVRAEIERLKGLTDKPFGVNLVLPLLRKGQVEACFDEQVPILVLFWGDPAPYVDEAHRCGIKVLLQVGSVSEAVAGAEAGVDAIIAQGVEAGGHVKGTTALSVLLPTIVDAVAPLPVIASGGIADGRGLVAALSLGAQGISIGTRFLASAEARAADAYKARIVMANAEDTVYTEQCNVGWANAPHRVLRTAAIERWERAGRPRKRRREAAEGRPCRFRFRP